MSRRAGALFAVALLVASAAAARWWVQRGAFYALPAPGTAGNILLVTIDTLRADALGAYGGRAKTPNLDRLAAEGARFTFAHAHSVLTLPSHASILTGRYPGEHGIHDNRGYRLPPDAVTLAGRLKTRGYATGAFVGAFPVQRRFGLANGFDVYDDRVGEVGSAGSLAETERPADHVVAPARQWIAAQTGPWFVWVHVFDPHAPYQPPEPYRGADLADPYAGEVSWTDAALGPLLDTLRASASPTLVVVTADHGEALGDHGELTHGVFAYEAVLRVPLIVTTIDSRRARATTGVVIDTPVRHVDIAPTILDAAGATADTALPGSTLRDVIASRRGADRPSYFEALMTNLERGWAPLRGVIVGHEKYIDLPIPELYDLTADPGEARNLARDRAERATVLRGVLSQFPSLVAAPVAERPDVEARLRSLGYVGSSGAARRDRYTERDDPKNLIAVDRRMQEATAAYTSGRTDEAIAMLRSVIADWPDNAEAYLDLAVASWHADRQADAIATLEDAITRGLPQPALRTKLGLCLALSGDGRRAIPLLERASQDDVETLNALGLAYAQVGRRADAIRTFERALVLDPTSGLALENIATVHITAGALGPAETALRKALALDDTLTGARTQLGGVLAATGRRDDAIATWVDAANRDPEAYEALYNAAVALVQGGRRDAAQPYVDRFLRTAPPSRYGRQIEQLRTLR